jgi:formate dehydrogenase subunit delta
MNVDNLVHMANQIGEFFSAYPDRQEALDGIANHIHKFWEPRMRTSLLDALAAGKVNELTPLVNDALLANQAKLRPMVS